MDNTNTIEFYIHHLANSIEISINNEDTIEDIRNKLATNLDCAIKRIRLYHMCDGKIKTGYSYYGLTGNELFLENYKEYKKIAVFLTL